MPSGNHGGRSTFRGPSAWGGGGTGSAPAGDTLAVTYPLTIDNTTDPSVENIQAFTVPHMEASLVPNAGVTNTATESVLATAGWTTTGTPQEINTGDIIRITAWGNHVNNDGAGRQTDIRVRVGGVGGTVVVAHRFSTTIVTPSAFLRYWRMEATVRIYTSAGLLTNSTSRMTLAVPQNTGLDDALANTRGNTSVAIAFTSDQEWVITADHDTASTNLTTILDGCIFEHIQARV